MLNKRADKLELIRIAEAVALEKSIDKELIISSMERTIGAKKVTYDFERMMEGADLVSCSGFADEMIKRM